MRSIMQNISSKFDTTTKRPLPQDVVFQDPASKKSRSQYEWEVALDRWVSDSACHPNERRSTAKQRILNYVFSENNQVPLNLSQLYLTSLPEEIYKLSQLTKLSLNLNCLSSLPAEIGNLTMLNELMLDGNRLTNLPDTLIINLKTVEVSIEDNPVPYKIAESLRKRVSDLKASDPYTRCTYLQFNVKKTSLDEIPLDPFTKLSTLLNYWFEIARLPSKEETFWDELNANLNLKIFIAFQTDTTNYKTASSKQQEAYA